MQSEQSFHRWLSRFNRERLTPSGDTNHLGLHLSREHSGRIAEARFVEAERARISRAALCAPERDDAFVEWFEDLRETGRGQNDPLFSWLETAAPLDAMKWFLSQEIGGEAGFDDLVALSQIKLPQRAKLELARNYWDEMGQGNAGGMHGPLLERLARGLGIDGETETVWESQALGNLMIALAVNRHYAFHSLGALGVIELTAPSRAVKVNAGLKRLGVPGDVRRYFALHATLDVRHSTAWNREVLGPLVAEDPRRAAWIAEGALMRLEAGARCFARYRAELGVEASGHQCERRAS